MTVEKIDITFVGGEIGCLEHALQRMATILQQGGQPDRARIYTHMLSKVHAAKDENKILEEEHCGHQTHSALINGAVLVCRLPPGHGGWWHREGDTSWGTEQHPDFHQVRRQH